MVLCVEGSVAKGIGPLPCLGFRDFRVCTAFKDCRTYRVERGYMKGSRT